MTVDRPIRACALCDGSGVSKDSAKGPRGGPKDTRYRYHCRDCRRPVPTRWRPRREHSNGDHRSGMAKVLAETDPDEVGP